MTQIPFTKMHGLGNDFVLINTITHPVSLTASKIAAMADRHTGIGFDQLLLVESAPNDSVDFGYRIFNADGSEAEQCGNGARCFAQFVRRQGLTDQNEITVQTISTVMQLRILDEVNVSVSMGIPTFLDAELSVPYSYVPISLGNPHCVLLVSQHDTDEIQTLGAQLQSAPAFASGVNVGFMRKIAPNHIALRVYERGAGETLACGSGACAAVVAGIEQELLEARTRVDLPGGHCEVYWQGEGEPVWLNGPTAHVFEGLY